MPFARREDARTLDKVKRDSVSVSLGNAQRGSRSIGIYYVNTTIGTPGQTIQLQLDTGSSDLWMFSDEACQSDDVMCLGGIFDPTQSSTYKLLFNGEFNISYVTPGSGVHGDYIRDNVKMGDAEIVGLTMGLAKEAKEVPTGIMGIGYAQNEAIYAQSGGKTMYPNIIDMMVNQSIINTRAYSLFLDDKEAATGTILFGGYDTDKFEGELALLDIQPDERGEFSSFIVAWTGFSITTENDGEVALTDSRFAEPAYLDSGTTLTVLPAQLAYQLIQAAGAVYEQSSDIYLVDCETASANATLNYQFGGTNGPTIKVPFSELVLPIRDANGDFVEQNGIQYCLFGIKPGDSGDILLFGDTFLRSAYVVYDLDGQAIGLAQARTGSTGSNIVEITGPIVSDASSVAGQPTATATATSRNAGIGGFESGVATASIPSATGTDGGLNFGGSATSTGAASTATTTSPSAASSVVPAFNWAAFGVIVGSTVVALLGGGLFVIF
ncbi:Candidapepsin-1 [Dactylellina cionopaga]|nr:Candidapepsin-1 [Dactylellina cionopaga]